MARLSEIFGLRDSDAEAPPVVAPVETPGAAQAHAKGQRDSADTSGAKIGEDNEALRNLLIDAGMKVRQFDEYKTFFTKLIEPATNALRTLEQEKTNNIDLRRKLEQ